MKSILLIRPPERFLPHRSWPMVSLPLGLLYLAAAIEKKGYRAEIIDGIMPLGDRFEGAGENFFGITFEEMKRRVSREDFDIVGISAQYTFQWANALKMARLCKEVNPSCKVIVGGAHVSVESLEIIKKYDCIDVAVQGEGEYLLPELAARLRGNLPLEGLSGIAFRSGDGVFCSENTYIEDLDSLPFPAYHLVDMERYFALMKEYSSRSAYKFPGWERGVSLITSRGCPYNCVFCSIHLHMGRRWRSHSAEYVLRHIEYLAKEHKVKYLHFEDDNLSFNVKRFEKILDGLLARKPPLRWDTPNGVRVDTFDENILSKCRESGCAFIVFGIESGVQRVLDENIKKALSLDRVEKVLAQAKKVGVDARAFFMMGLPGESEEDIKASIKYALRLMWEYECFGGFSMAVPLLGTKLYDECRDKGYFYLEPTIENLSLAYLKQGIIKTEGFSAEFLNEMSMYFERRATVMFFLVFIRKITRDWRLLLYVVKSVFTSRPREWSSIYYKAILFHHAVLFDYV